MAKIKMRGSISRLSGPWYWKTYASVNLKTGEPCERKQQRLLLCRKDEQHPDVASVDEIYRGHKARVEEFEAKAARGEKLEPTAQEITVTQFYLTVFLPWLESIVKTRQKSHSTLVSYKRYWDKYLAPPFNGVKTLKGYSPSIGSKFLRELRKEDGSILGLNTLRHIHSTASGIFQFAVEEEYIDHNPWRD